MEYLVVRRGRLAAVMQDGPISSGAVTMANGTQALSLVHHEAGDLLLKNLCLARQS